MVRLCGALLQGLLGLSPPRLFLFLIVLGLARRLDAAVPYTWKNVQIRGGGYVSGLTYHPLQAGLVYARTDVGGAYRWEESSRTWTPLNDDLGRADSQRLGVLGVALDPTDADRVYLACGQYTAAWGATAIILRSTDRGASWARTDLSIKLGGNQDGRGSGERFVVDPNLPSTLYLGSSVNGLWRSTDYGASFSQTFSSPSNISWVCLDPSTASFGSPTQGLYVGVAATSSNVRRSLDGGGTWAVVSGAPTGLYPMRYALRGQNLYITYASAIGPNGSSSGAVWRYHTGTGVWTNLNVPACPAAGQGGWSGLSVDSSNPDRIAVATLDCWGGPDRIQVTQNGGASWSVVQNAFDYSIAPYASASTPHWMTDLQIDPFDGDRAMFVTGYGVWYTGNFTSAYSGGTVDWSFENIGLEETVPLEIISPPAGAPLVSVLGDLDGFRHDDLDQSPPSGRHTPRRGTNRGLDFAELLPSKMARTFDWANPRRGAYSLDGGTSWTIFAAEPAGAAGAGQIALAADGSALVWAPEGLSVYRSTNNGGSWTASGGSVPASLKPVADRVNPNKFYVYDGANGRVFVSTDKAVGFSVGATGLPLVASWLLGDANLRAVPGYEGDLWLTCSGGGLYRSTTSGLSFSKIASVSQAYQVGLGMPLAPAVYPALYLHGVVGGVEGLFRSDDQGGSWTRINDGQHQFGWINDITGDPRVYGRVYLATGGRGLITGEPAGTPTPSPTLGPTGTVSPTPTFSATSTGTPTWTPTFSHSASPTETPSPTSSYSASLSPTVSASPTPSGTETSTHTASSTATESLTLTASASPSPSFSESETKTKSDTKTATQTPTPTLTPSPTPSGTFTSSPSPLVSLFWTASSSPTPSPPSTETRSPSPPPSVPDTPTMTPGELEIVALTVAPNPVTGDLFTLFLKLSAPSDQVIVSVFSSSGRWVRHAAVVPASYGSFEPFALDTLDSLGSPLANGIYHLRVQVFSGSRMADQAVHSFFVMR